MKCCKLIFSYHWCFIIWMVYHWKVLHCVYFVWQMDLWTYGPFHEQQSVMTYKQHHQSFWSVIQAVQLKPIFIEMLAITFIFFQNKVLLHPHVIRLVSDYVPISLQPMGCKSGPIFIKLLKQKIWHGNFLLSRNEKETSHRMYILWHVVFGLVTFCTA